MASLNKSLLPRHVRMMALGGAIGAGIFQGSSETISTAGPGVVIAYLLAGLLLFVVMSAMAEMALRHPGRDLRGLVHDAFGPRLSLLVGWLYFINWILVMAVEVVVAGTFLSYWLPGVPVWLLSLASSLFIISVNLASVRLFGEIEYWLAGIKIGTLIIFILLGGLILTGIIPGAGDGPNGHHWTAHGGFLPHGMTGVLSALLVVVFSYGGTEMIGLTLREMKDPEKSLPGVIRGVMVRVVLFYVLPLLVITGLIPWNEASAKGSPFVHVLSSVGLKGAAHVMNAIMLSAVLSAAITGMYATSRLLHSLAEQGEAPRAFTRVNRKGVPVAGIWVSMAGLMLGTMVAFFAPESVFRYLMGIPGFSVLFMWILICLSYLRLRKKSGVETSYRTPLGPVSVGLTAVLLIVILGFFLFNPDNRISTLIVASVFTILTVTAFAVHKGKHSSQDAA
ncbi:amino acid permease [Staphylospora marina]|uniref:amino acid permease n=1 Tax=Staphylospora marina TaxID=2490858 RepID=UPI000F5BD37A|nr:amino acid permease [Staphylospora marina]